MVPAAVRKVTVGQELQRTVGSRRQQESKVPIMQVKLRPMEPSDFQAVLALWRRTSETAFPQIQSPQSGDWWQARLREVIAKNAVWVADLGAALAGFMAIDEAAGYIDQLFIDVSAQRTGIGSAFIDLAKSLSPNGLRLHTLVENAAGRAFYEKLGFRAGGLETEAFGGRPNVEYIWRPEGGGAAKPR
jgi:ribosomal protein S18 acetylase RimI-like enzyme